MVKISIKYINKIFLVSFCRILIADSEYIDIPYFFLFKGQIIEFND